MKTPPKKTKPKNRWGGSWTHLLHPPSTPSPPPPFTYHSLPLPLSSEREGGEKRVISKWGEKEGGERGWGEDVRSASALINYIDICN